MADSKITALASIGTGTDPANDQLVIVDVSDVLPTGMALSGTTKRVGLNQLLSSSPTATGAFSVTGLVTAGSATITGDLTVDTSTLKVDSTNNRVGIGTASPATILDIQSAGSVFARIYNTTSTADAYLLVKNGTGEGFFGINATGPYIYTAGSLPITFTTATSERYRIASDGVATWSNVGGVAGTAMTLNATGLGIGATPAERLTIGSTTAANYIKLTNLGAATGLLIGSFNTAVDIKNREVGAINLFTSDTQRMVISATGDVTISTGNVVMGTSGKGIDFSATANSSGTMTSELLNDYEEGTFTPVVQGGSTAGTATYSFQSGQYTKVGRLVTFTLRVVYTGGTGAGNLQIGGLPFTVGVPMSNFTIYIENISLNANSIPFARSASSISYIGIEQTTTGGGTVSSVTYDAAGDIQISGFYTV